MRRDGVAVCDGGLEHMELAVGKWLTWLRASEYGLIIKQIAL